MAATHCNHSLFGDGTPLQYRDLNIGLLFDTPRATFHADDAPYRIRSQNWTMTHEQHSNMYMSQITTLEDDFAQTSDRNIDDDNDDDTDEIDDSVQQKMDELLHEHDLVRVVRDELASVSAELQKRAK